MSDPWKTDVFEEKLQLTLSPMRQRSLNAVEEDPFSDISNPLLILQKININVPLRKKTKMKNTLRVVSL